MPIDERHNVSSYVSDMLASAVNIFGKPKREVQAIAIVMESIAHSLDRLADNAEAQAAQKLDGIKTAVDALAVKATSMNVSDVADGSILKPIESGGAASREAAAVRQFVGWLTTREQALQVGAEHTVYAAFDAAEDFIGGVMGEPRAYAKTAPAADATHDAAELPTAPVALRPAADR